MRQPEGGGVGETGAAHLPRVAGDDELVARGVERIEIDVQCFALDRVALSVHQYPALLAGIPILAHPMVFELAGREICAEAASRSRRNSLSAKDGTEHQREMTTDTGQAMTDIARIREWPRIERVNSRQHLRDRTKVTVVALL